MTVDLVSVMFPTGQVELRTSEVVPKVGDTLKHGTDEWQVIEVGTDRLRNTVVTLGPKDELRAGSNP